MKSKIFETSKLLRMQRTNQGDEMCSYRCITTNLKSYKIHNNLHIQLINILAGLNIQYWIMDGQGFHTKISHFKVNYAKLKHCYVFIVMH